jgi:ERCC4-type nuclease
MRIIVDTREQLGYDFQGYDVNLETAALPTGDYSLKGFEDRVALERKSIDDLVSVLMNDNRIRFEKELARGRHLEIFHVVVEASLADVAEGRYTSAMRPHSALQSILAFTVRFGTSFIWAGSRRGGEYVTFWLLSKYLRELQERFKAATKSQERAA